MFDRVLMLTLVVLASALTVSCKDKAEPDYAKCVQADTAGEVQAAWTACNAAVAADPNSTSGKAAATKLAELKPKYNAAQASQGATAVQGVKASHGPDDQVDPEDQAVLDRTAARADRQHARAEQRSAQAQAAATATQAACGSIQHDPALAAIFSIESATASSDGRACNVIIQAKMPITQRLLFNWIFYDKDGVKLGDAVGYMDGLGVGDKQKLLLPFGAIVGTAVAKIVSKPK